MAIQLFRPTYRVDETLAAIKECLDIGWTGMGFKTLELENAWREYTGLPHAHFLNSATAGLHLAIHVLKEHYCWNDGDEIITTPITFVSTNHSILYENLHPVFADVDPSLCLDPDSVESKINARTRAVLFVGMGGNVGQLDRIVKICQDHDLRLILDAAHMAGTRKNGRHVGSESDVCVFSFHAVKNLPTADGGMICFADKKFDDKVRRLSWLGIDKNTYQRTQGKSSYQWEYSVDDIGFKYHGNSVMASIGLVSLKYLDQDNAYRRQIASWYDQLLSGIPGIRIIEVSDGCESSRHLYQIAVEHRDEIILALNNSDIYPGVHYESNVHYPMYRYAQGTCPVAEYYSKHILSLPINIKMSYSDVCRIGNTLIEIVNKLNG